MTNLTPEDQKRVEEWQKLAREKLAPNVTHIDKKFAEAASWAQELLNAFWVEQQKDLDELLTTLLQQKNAEIEAAVEAERERLLQYIQQFIDDNSGYDYSGDLLLASLASFIEKALTPTNPPSRESLPDRPLNFERD